MYNGLIILIIVAIIFFSTPLKKFFSKFKVKVSTDALGTTAKDTAGGIVKKILNLLLYLVVYLLALYFISVTFTTLWYYWTHPFWLFLITNILLILCFLISTIFPKQSGAVNIILFLLVCIMLRHTISGHVRERRIRQAVAQAEEDAELAPQRKHAADLARFKRKGSVLLKDSIVACMMYYKGSTQTRSHKGPVVYQNAIDTTLYFYEDVPVTYAKFPRKSWQYQEWKKHEEERLEFPDGPTYVRILHDGVSNDTQRLFDWW